MHARGDCRALEVTFSVQELKEIDGGPLKNDLVFVLDGNTIQHHHTIVGNTCPNPRVQGILTPRGRVDRVLVLVWESLDKPVLWFSIQNEC